jgi:SAM-dependent MidA family methyltransferase
LLRLGVGLAGRNVDGGISFEWRARVADGRCEGDDEFSRQVQRLQALWSSSHLLAAGESLPEGYCGEWQPSLAAWIGSLANSLSHGVIVLADYGLPRAQLYHPDRVVGTLRCHQRHHAHADPFSCPGLVDITSWVDFSTVAEAAETAGLTVSVFTTQMGFLLASGTTTRPVDAKSAQGLRQLLLPGEMGEAIKFMVLSRELDLTAQSTHDVLARQDLRESLGI